MAASSISLMRHLEMCVRGLHLWRLCGVGFAGSCGMLESVVDEIAVCMKERKERKEK